MNIARMADWRKGATPSPVPTNYPITDKQQAGTCLTLHSIARLLGVPARSERWKARYIKQLIDDENFPAPLPMLVDDGLTREISPRRSRWLAEPVCAWFAGHMPPHAVANAEDAAALEAAARLDRSARDLFEGDA